MSERDPVLSDAELDRLVDNELTPRDRRELIAALADDPDGWRRCALAFLESQSLAAHLGAIAADPIATDVGGAAAFRPAEASPPASNRGMHWLAIAASLLAAFGIGWQFSLHAFKTPPSPDLLVDNQPELAPSQPQLPVAPAVDSRDAVTLVVRDASGSPQRLQVPLIEAERLGGALADDQSWQPSPPLRERLRDNGLDVQVRRRYAPFYFEHERGLSPMLVPVDDAVITPVSREVF